MGHEEDAILYITFTLLDACTVCVLVLVDGMSCWAPWVPAGRNTNELVEVLDEVVVVNVNVFAGVF